MGSFDIDFFTKMRCLGQCDFVLKSRDEEYRKYA